MVKNDFFWGTATASFQIEGAAYEDGKGLSVWDVFCKQPDKIFQNHNGDIACDHYHRYEDDLKLLKDLGVNAYRFSLSWPRILPQGTGKVNQKGLDFYKKIIDLLLKYDITPFLTLYHWDMPYELHKKGGFLNREFSDWFFEYTDIVSQTFKDTVKHYITFNEPQCVIGLGYGNGLFAPGYSILKNEIYCAVHNLLLSHGKAVQAVRSNVKDADIGIVTCGNAFYPAARTAQNIAAAKEMLQNRYDESSMVIYTDPIHLGKYPAVCYQKYPEFFENISQNDLKIISSPVDFLGINNYEGLPVIADDSGRPRKFIRPAGYPITDTGWAVEEEGIYWLSRFCYELYKKPIYITENGMAGNDWIHLDGKVHDPARIDYLSRYIAKVKEAIQDGIDIRGYFVWSLMDNFEWSSGYSKRFGLIHVDYSTQKRTPKDSYYWYRDFISKEK